MLKAQEVSRLVQDLNKLETDIIQAARSGHKKVIVVNLSDVLQKVLIDNGYSVEHKGAGNRESHYEISWP